MRNDPSDNGGLFVGRRPGTRKIKYRELPAESSPGRRKIDKALAAMVGLVMLAANLLLWGPIPLAWLWIVAHLGGLANHPFWAVLVAFTGILFSMLLMLMLLMKLDQAWILSRRASGVEQTQGVLTRMFLGCSLLGAILFGLWLIFGGGLASGGGGAF
jgi:hypothetical protein